MRNGRFSLLALGALTAASPSPRPAPPPPWPGHDPGHDYVTGFPKAGYYRAVSDGDGPSPEQRRVWIDATNPQAFERYFAASGSRCRDRRVTVSGGFFSASDRCDAPDGDIHNIGTEIRGTYSAESIEFTRTITLWGRPYRQHVSYRLEQASPR